MIINSIELQNIRSYDKEKIEFPRGITLFEGDIGSGKSTILMGIEFALFGLGSQKPEALLSKKANDGYVVLNFEAGGQKCEVKRTLKRKGDTLSQDPKNTYLKINDEVEPLSPTELKQKVLQILNFNEPGDPRSESRIYRYAVFTPQEEMKHILYDSAKRLETIRKAFGVEDYKIAVENSKEILRFLHEKMGIFKERFRDMSKHESERDESSKSVAKIDSDNRELVNQEKKSEHEKKKLLEDLDAIRYKKQEQRDLEASRKNIEDHIGEKISEKKKIAAQSKQTSDELKELEMERDAQKKISRPTSKSIEEISQKIKEFTELNKTISNLEYRRASLAEDVSKLQARLGAHKGSSVEESKAHLEKFREERARTQKEHDALQSELKAMQKEEARLESEKEACQKNIKDVSKLGATCPYCKHELSEEYKMELEGRQKQALAGIESQLEKATKERCQREAAMSRLEKAISSADDNIRTASSIIPDLENMVTKSRELSETEASLKQAAIKYAIPDEDDLPKLAIFEGPVEYFTDLKDMLQKYHNAESRISDIEKTITRLDRLKKQEAEELEAKSSQIRQLEKELAKCTNRLQTFEGIDEQFSEMQDHISNLDSEIKSLSNSISINNERIETEKRRISELDAKILEAKKWKDIHKRYSNYHDWLGEFFIPAVDRIEKQVLLSIQQNFNETYHRWYSILIDDPTKESRIDESFTPIIEQDGYEQDITFLSGGEKTSVALAYRLTLNSLMRQESDSMQSNLLILDEPTDGFSKTQLGKVKTVLSELKSQQIILVSHEKELETYVNNIFQINKSSGISKVTRLDR